VTVRVLLVEDEPLARRTLREFAGEVPWLAVVGEAADGPEAVRQLDALRPDLVLLDVELPGWSGLQVLARSAHRPAVVFTTAYDRYAVRAFEVEAIDYLVKPFGRDRFHAMCERVQRRLVPQPEAGLEAAAGAARMASEPRAVGEAPVSLPASGPSSEPFTRVFARRGAQLVPVRADEIVRVEAEDDYAAVHTAGGQRHLLGLTLGALERRLDPARFVRVHRSHLVNLDFVEALQAYDAHRLVVRLRGGAEVVTSRAGATKLRAFVA